MPKKIYFDCSSGISGDMTVAALLGLFPSPQEALLELEKALRALPYSGYQIGLETVERSYIVCRRFLVEVREDQPARHFTEIRDSILSSTLPRAVQERSVLLFQRIGGVEARIHGCSLDEVHFHEIGAIDSIVDIVSAAWLLDRLGADTITAGSIVPGHGRIKTEHGLMPIPAPATLELLRGAPLEISPCEGELITPTGAAILTLASSFGPAPAGIPLAVGYGAGTKLYPGVPGFLRACLLQTEEGLQLGEDEVEVLEANLDDLPPQAAAPLGEALQAAGAVDVFFTPLMMKKGRPAFQVTALCPPEKSGSVLRQMFLHSSTLGVRRTRAKRSILSRWPVELTTAYGPIVAKAAQFEARITVQPEYESCRAAASRLGVPYLEVFHAAMAAAHAFSASEAQSTGS